MIAMSIIYIKDKMTLYKLTKYVSPCCGADYCEIDHDIEHSDCCQIPMPNYPYSFKCPKCKEENYISFTIEEYYCDKCLESFKGNPLRFHEYVDKLNGR